MTFSQAAEEHLDDVYGYLSWFTGDRAAAEDLTGVARMRSTAKLPGFKPSDWPILAAGKVRHAGEPIAMAIGSTPAEAEDIAGLVEVDFEALRPVVTMADALKKTPPFVHDDWGDNILVDIKLEGGDLAGAKANAVHIVERTFRMNRMHPLALEGRACLAHYDSRLDELVVHVAHQLPVPLQIGLSQVLGISQRRLRVIVPDVGASFGLKTYVESETVAVAWAAMKLRRPVRWIQDRYESLVCDANCRDYQCKIIGYADASGRVLGLECDVVVDSGAYSPWPWPAGIEGGLALGNIQGCYDIRALRGRAINVVSNKPAGQPFRGVARPLSCIGHEIVMDGIAEMVGIDPVEARAYSLGANSLARLGEREHSRQWSEQSVALAPNDPVILYNAACNLAQLGEHDRALDRLERSIEAGVAVGDWIKHDPDFENLRDHPRFQAIVKRIAPTQVR